MARKGNTATLTDADTIAALERVLSHAETHGEVYDGATADHTLIREAFGIPSDDAAADDNDDDGDKS